MRGLDEELLGASAKRDRSSHGNTWFSPSGTQSVGDLRRAESAGGSAKTEGCEAFVGAFAGVLWTRLWTLFVDAFVDTICGRVCGHVFLLSFRT